MQKSVNLPPHQNKWAGLMLNPLIYLNFLVTFSCELVWVISQIWNLGPFVGHETQTGWSSEELESTCAKAAWSFNLIFFLNLFDVKYKVCVPRLVSVQNNYSWVCILWFCIKICSSLRFVGGKLNMCFNAVDRHVESGRGEQPAIIYDSPVTGTKQIITFRELQEQVAASLLKPHVVN